MPRAERSTTRRIGRAALATAGALGAAWLSLAVAAPVDSPAGAVVFVAPDASRAWLAAAGLAVFSLMALDGAAALLPFAALLAPFLFAGVPAGWVFAGPGITIVWATALTFHRWPAWAASALPEPLRHAPWIPLALGVVWLGGCAAAVEQVAMRGDAPHYLTIAHSLVVDGDLDLRNDYDDRSYRDFYAGRLEPRHTVLTPTGAEYSFHGVGAAVLVAPGYRWLGARGATLTLVLLLAGGASLVWAAVRQLTSDTGAAWFAWAALVSCAPFTLHAASIYPDGPAAVGVAAALWLIVRLADRPPVGEAVLVLASCGLAALPWLHVRLALPAAIFGASVITAILRSQPDRWSRVLWFMVVPTISCAGWFASTYVMFGTWNPTAIMLQRTAPGALATAPAGIFGMLMDQEFGLWPVAPVFVAAPLALGRLLAPAPVLAAGSAVAALGVLATSSLWVWWGGDSAPARFLTVVLPVLSLWLGAVWAHAGAGARRALAVGLAWSAAMTALLVQVDDGSHAYNYPDGTSSIFEALSPVVDVASALPSMFRANASLSTELPVALIWAAALLFTVWVVASPRTRTPLRAGLAALAVLAATASAAGVAWRVRGVNPWTPGIAQQRLLERLASPAGRAVAFSPWRGRIEGDPLALLRLRSPESVPRSAGVLLHVPDVPAGRYAVHVEAADSGDDELSLELGREAEPYARWRASTPPPMLTLARGVHSVRVVGRAGTARDVWLAPVEVWHTGTQAVARRVTRIGDFDVYSMDDDTHVEGAGLWTGGNRSTSVVVAGDPGRPVTVRFAGGPARVEVDIDAGEVHRTVAVEPQGAASLTLGAASATRPVEVRLTIRGGFAASQIRQGDARTLGVWMTFEPTATAEAR